MQEGLVSGWHISRAGVAYGPYQWADLAVWAGDGRLAADDLVWQQGLPGWMPARQVPGLFAPSAAPIAREPAARRSSRNTLWAVLLPVAALVLVGATVGILFATGVFSDGVPLVETPMRGPTVIDVPYDAAEYVVSPVGGVIEMRGVEISVPKRAVDTDTTLEVKILRDDFKANSGAPPEDAGTVAFCVGPVVDFGPEGLVFEKPVTISVPYDETLLPHGVSEDAVTIAYWDGVMWVEQKGMVDKDKNTVRVEVMQFNGTSWRDTLDQAAVVAGWVTGPATQAWVHVGITVTDPEHVWTDPISRGEASNWVKPTTTVKEYASRALLYDRGNDDTKSLGDPDLAAWLESKAKLGIEPVLAYKDQAGGVQISKYEKRPPRTDWQLPDVYFQKGVSTPLTGDCADVACSAVAVFLAKDFHSVGVYGYVKRGLADEGATHQWAEVLIGDKKYFVDQDGGLHSFSENPDDIYIQRYEPATDWAHRNCMFDDKGQKPYDPDWYKQYVTSTTTTSTITVEVSKWAGTELQDGKKWADIEVDFSLPSGGRDGSVSCKMKLVDGPEQDLSYIGRLEEDGTYVVYLPDVELRGRLDAGGTLTLTTFSGRRQMVWELRPR
jgi:hypothetical protein